MSLASLHQIWQFLLMHHHCCLPQTPCLGPSAASSSSPRAASDLEQARPQTSGEEELQLQLALAMSREENQKVKHHTHIMICVISLSSLPPHTHSSSVFEPHTRCLLMIPIMKILLQTFWTFAHLHLASPCFPVTIEMDEDTQLQIALNQKQHEQVHTHRNTLHSVTFSVRALTLKCVSLCWLMIWLLYLNQNASLWQSNDFLPNFFLP